LNDFSWESIALIHFGLSHELNTVRLGVNLSAPSWAIERAIERTIARY
jgi:hypothetical protein